MKGRSPLCQWKDWVTLVYARVRARTVRYGSHFSWPFQGPLCRALSKVLVYSGLLVDCMKQGSVALQWVTVLYTVGQSSKKLIGDVSVLNGYFRF